MLPDALLASNVFVRNFLFFLRNLKAYICTSKDTKPHYHSPTVDTSVLLLPNSMEKCMPICQNAYSWIYVSSFFIYRN